MTCVFGVVLAGGLARRMGGGDKGLLSLGNKTVLDHVISRLAPQVSTLAINANGDLERFASLGCDVIPDTIDGFMGPLAGVLSGMRWASAGGADAIVTVAADSPFFPIDLVDRFGETVSGMQNPLTLAATMDVKAQKTFRHPTFGLWPVSLADDLEVALRGGLRKVVLWTDKNEGRITVFEHIDGVDPFFNINTPQDLEIAQAYARNTM